MKYKALMLDLDGTVIPNRRDGMPSPGVTEAIAQAKDLIHIGIATGRPLRMVTPITDHLHLSGPVIFLGGAQIYDITERKVLRENPISKEDLYKVLLLLKPFNPLIYIDERDYSVQYTEAYKPKEPFALLVDNLSEKEADEIISKIVHIPTISAHKIFSWEKGKMCVNISHAYSTKQHAILEVAQILNIEPHEIIGVGDGYNDFPLLMACGLKVAMGNAAQELKDIADYIAPSVEDDGVADVIQKFILEK